MKRMMLVALFGLAACVDPHETLSPDFGNAVQTNIDAQVVNPTPPPRVVNANGQRIENAIRRYQTNTVYPPQTESATPLSNTTTSTGGGGSAAPAGGQ